LALGARPNVKARRSPSSGLPLAADTVSRSRSGATEVPRLKMKP
jgi:hypothetical protein